MDQTPVPDSSSLDAPPSAGDSRRADLSDLADYQRGLTRHLLETAALALGAAGALMFLAMVAIAMVTDDFPGRWMTGVLGALAAAVVLQSQVGRTPWFRRDADG